MQDETRQRNQKVAHDFNAFLVSKSKTAETVELGDVIEFMMTSTGINVETTVTQKQVGWHCCLLEILECFVVWPLNVAIIL